jgi:toxin ParE1/3/4
VPRYRLSSGAEADLAAIADYTIQTFGQQQARRYREGLKSCFKSLSKLPMQGSRADELAEGLRRFQWRSHVIFYMPDERGIFVVRVLHETMDWRSRFGINPT